MEKLYLIVGGRCYETRRLLKEFKLKNKKCRIIPPEDLLMYVEDRTNGDCLYYVGGDAPERIYKKDLHCVLPRIGKGLEVHAKAIKHIQNLGIPVTSESEGLLIAKDKMLTTLKLSEGKVETPKTILYRKPVHFDWIVSKLGGFPIVSKLLSGSRGVGVFILSDRLSAATALETFSSLGHSLQLQAYIESSDKDTNKHDYRVIIIDNKVVCCIKRFSLSGDFRSNASISKTAENHVPSEAMKTLALKAAAAVGLSSACGVDIVERNTDKKMFVIECNGNFGFQNAEKFSGVNVAKEIVDYAIQLAKDENTSDTKTVTQNASLSALIIKDDPDNGIPFGDFPTDDTIQNEASASATTKVGFWSNVTKELKKQGVITEPIKATNEATTEPTKVVTKATTEPESPTGIWENSALYKELKENAARMKEKAARIKQTLNR